MTLVSGSRVGPYDVVSSVGAGGMGEVYRARDTRLQRDVALKVLPTAFASDPHRMSRFEREAQLLAALTVSASFCASQCPVALVPASSRCTSY